MQPHPREPRPFFKLRCVLVAAFFCVFLPGGHFALPQGIAFLRFLNERYAPGGWDYVILGCTIIAVVVSFVPIRRAVLLLDAVAAAFILAALVLVQWRWADPLDVGLIILTASPWAVLTAVLIFLDACTPMRPAQEHCAKCNYDRTGLAAGAVCPECGAAAGA